MTKLKIEFFTGEPCPTPNQINLLDTKRIEYVWQQCREAGYADLKEVAKAVANSLGTQQICKINKALLHLNSFADTGDLKKIYMQQLTRLVGLDHQEMDRIHARHLAILNADSRLFIQNFDLLYRNSEKILADERYRNIIFYGLFFSSAYTSRERPLTLGELYLLWNKNEWITPDCCGQVYLYSAGGSPLSGSHSYFGYCCGCNKSYRGRRPTFMEIMKPFMDHVPGFPFEPTDYTIGQLIDDLKAMEGPHN